MAEKELNHNWLLNDTNLATLEQELREVFHKLHFTENQLKEMRLEVQQITIEKLETEQLVEQKVMHLSQMKLELEMKDNIISKWEQEKNLTKDNFARQQIQLESLNNEKIMLQDHLNKLQIENMTLKQKTKEFDEQLNYQVMLEETINAKYLQTVENFENINTEFRKLEKDQKLLKKTAEKAVILGESMVSILTQHHSALNRANKEIENLVNQIISQQAEIERLQDSEKNSEIKYIPLFTSEENLEQQTMIKRLNKQIDVNENHYEKLNSILEESVQESLRFQQLEENFKHHIKDVIDKIEFIKKND